MNANLTEVEYQDIIIQEPELLLASLTPDQSAILKNPRYLNLIKIIHKIDWKKWSGLRLTFVWNVAET